MTRRPSPSVISGLVSLLVLASLAGSAPAAQITGVVREQGTLNPIAGARVTLQASDIHTLTLGDGSYVLELPSGANQVVVGARKGYYNASLLVTPPASGVDFLLDAVPVGTNPGYAFVEPTFCSSCHTNQLIEWLDTPMARAGLNTWVHDIYSGTGTPGGMGGFVYLRDSVHAGANPDSECASCHQPELWIKNGFAGAMDDNIANPLPGVAHGISCDTCHKIADIDEAKVNFPGIYPGAVTYTQPAGATPLQVQYGLNGDVDYNAPFLMRASYQPQLEAAVCAACHQDKNDPGLDGDFEEPDGIISEPTYLEWLASDYSDPESPAYASCVDCHMPPSGADTICAVLFPPLLRDPASVRSHDIRGTTPEYLENAVELAVDVGLCGGALHVDVDIVNSLTGHHVPTGVTIRNMILLVEAWRDGDDPLTSPLPYVGSQVVHDLGGIGDPALGYYAGLPGKYFSKVNHNGTSGPTFFTDAVGITSDNRIPAGQTDSSSYDFVPPPGGGTVHVRARLIYRRGFRFLVDAKQWSTDGHGNPLADVTPPHYGHLMELDERTIELPRVTGLRPTGPLGQPSPGLQPLPGGPTPPALGQAPDGTLVLTWLPPCEQVDIVTWGRSRDGALLPGKVTTFTPNRRGELSIPLRALPRGALMAQASVTTEQGKVVLSEPIEIAHKPVTRR